MFRFDTPQKVHDIGGVKVGGQPGENPMVMCGSIFQKGDRVFEGRRKQGFDENRAAGLLKTQDRLAEETGVPGMADIVANSGAEFKTYIDFVTSVSDMPFCIDAWVMKPKLEGAAYCAEKGLLDRMFYNSLTVWEQDLETEIKEIAAIGVKHVLLVAFDQEDQTSRGRVTGTQKILDAIDQAGAEFESILVDTSVMGPAAVSFCSAANRLIKEKWGFPAASAPSNGIYMWKEAREKWGFKAWAGADAALESLAAVLYHDLSFSGPMAGAERLFPAVGLAESYLALMIYDESGRMPENQKHPLYKLFPDFVARITGQSK